jgi:hypothetical protein
MADEHRTIHTDAGPSDAPPGRDVPSDAPLKPTGPPEAPYGYTDKGTPRKGPYRARPGRKKAAAGKPRSAKTGRIGKDYREALAGVVQVALVPLGVLGARPGNEVFLADVVAVADNAPPVIEALNDLAQDNPLLGRVFDKLGAVGPYGALIAALTPMVAQLATNHGALPLEVTGPLGAMPPDALLAKAGVEAPPTPPGPPVDGEGDRGVRSPQDPAVVWPSP